MPTRTLSLALGASVTVAGLALGGLTLTSPLTISAAAAAAPSTFEHAGAIRSITVGKGDTLFTLLVEAGISRHDAAAATEAVRQYFNPRRLKSGQSVIVRLGDAVSGERSLVAFSLEVSDSGYVEVARSEGGDFLARRTQVPLSARTDIFGQMTDRALLTVQVRRGDTIGSILRKQGIDRFEAEAAVSALRARFNPRRLKTGQTISVLPEDSPTGRIGLAGLAVHMDNGQVVEVVRAGDSKFTARKTSRLSLGAGQMSSSTYAVDETVSTKERVQTVKIAKGDTLMRVLTRAGAPRSAADQAIMALNQHYDPRRLKPGQELSIVTRLESGRTVLTGLAITIDSSIYIQVLLNGDQEFVSVKSSEPLQLLAHAPVRPAISNADAARMDAYSSLSKAVISTSEPQADVPRPVAEKPALVKPLAKPEVRTARANVKADTKVEATPAAKPDVVVVKEPAAPVAEEQTPAAEAVASTTPAPEGNSSLVVVNVMPGDTLMAILRRAGFDRHEADRAIRSMRKVFNPRRLSIGQKITLASSVDPTGGTTLEGVSVKLKNNKYAQVTRKDEKSFGAARVDEPKLIELAALTTAVLKPDSATPVAANTPRLGQGRAMQGAAVAAAAPRVVSRPDGESAVASTAEDGAAKVLSAIEPALAPVGNLVRKAVVIGKGDTLYVALTRAGSGGEEAEDAIAAFRKVHNPRKLQIGQTLSLAFDTEQGDSGQMRLAEVALDIAPDRDVVVKRDDAGRFLSEEVERPLVHSLERATGSISSNLYDAATDAGLPIDVLMETMHIFSYDVDFQREIQQGDRFEILFQTVHNERGEPVETGPILYAALWVSNQKIELYRYEAEDGPTDYLDANGKSARKALMRTPINGARLSSGFGMRKHPILGYSRMHQGIDFAAARGTPVLAAGDGVIERVGRNGSYGKYVRIRHNGTYQTAYAHLNGYAKGMKSGKRIRQGQVIGYVGSTGRSTGPHLHYEVLKNGKQINPRRLKLPTGRTLSGAELADFQAQVQKIQILVAEVPSVTRVASQ